MCAPGSLAGSYPTVDISNVQVTVWPRKSQSLLLLRLPRDCKQERRAVARTVEPCSEHEKDTWEWIPELTSSGHRELKYTLIRIQRDALTLAAMEQNGFAGRHSIEDSLEAPRGGSGPLVFRSNCWMGTRHDTRIPRHLDNESNC